MTYNQEPSVPWSIEREYEDTFYIRTGPGRGLGRVDSVIAQSIVDAHNTDVEIALMGRHEGFRL